MPQPEESQVRAGRVSVEGDGGQKLKRSSRISALSQKSVPSQNRDDGSGTGEGLSPAPDSPSVSVSVYRGTTESDSSESTSCDLVGGCYQQPSPCSSVKERNLHLELYAEEVEGGEIAEEGEGGEVHLPREDADCDNSDNRVEDATTQPPIAPSAAPEGPTDPDAPGMILLFCILGWTDVTMLLSAPCRVPSFLLSCNFLRDTGCCVSVLLSQYRIYHYIAQIDVYYISSLYVFIPVLHNST